MTSLSHIMIGVSGGVDSAVSAYLLKKEGHHLEAVFMQNWQGEDDNCPIAEDLADAEAICDQLKIPLRVINFSDDYWASVFTHFLNEYRNGRTPNPDILCNKEIKFRAFLDYAKQQGADFIATGHYVRRTFFSPTQLLKGLDPEKDQSYFLHALNNQQLLHSLFPVGTLKKTEVREIAKTLRLKNHAKKDSTGICFIGERKFKTFLANYLPAKPGDIMTPDDEIIGQHDGLMFYTIGQRQGLQIGGQKGKSESPWYVAEKDLAHNILRVVQGDQHPALFKQTLIARDVNWIEGKPPLSSSLHAKIRYRQADQACSIELIDNDHYLVRFQDPQRAVTPGQSIVFYQDDICLGGGIIES